MTELLQNDSDKTRRIFVGGGGGLNSSDGVLKKQIKLGESNERLNFIYQFL